MRADDVLNKEVIEKYYGMLWTKGLSLEEPVEVAVGVPYSRTVTVARGDTIQHTFEFSEMQLDGFTVVEQGTDKVLTNASTIDQDTSLMMCHEVVARNVEDGHWFVEHGKTLSSIAVLRRLLESGMHMCVDAKDTTVKYNLGTVVERHMTFDVVKKPRVVVDIPPTDPRDVNTADVLHDILTMVDESASAGLGVGTGQNDNGKVEQLIIYVTDDNTAEDLTNKLNNMYKGPNCKVGILCKSTGARVLYDDPSSASKVSATFTFLIFILSVVLFSS